MAASILFDQAGLPPGVPGQSRSDGLANGAAVTVTNASGQPCRCEFWWRPPGDSTATLVQSGPNQWTFSPEAAQFGEYIVRMVEAEGTENETEDTKSFGIRLPGSGLLIPGLNNRGDFEVNLASTADKKNLAASTSFNNEPLPDNPAVNYAGWWQALRELYQQVEQLTNTGGGSGDGVTVQYWEPLYAGTAPNVHANFADALAAALAADGEVSIKMQVGASPVFTLPDQLLDGEGRVTLEGPDTVGLVQLMLGSNTEFVDWLGVIGPHNGTLQFNAVAPGPNGAVFRFTNPSIAPVFMGGIDKNPAAPRVLVLFDWGNFQATFRELWIGNRTQFRNAGDITSDGALRLQLFEPGSTIGAGLVVPSPPHVQPFEVVYWSDYPRAASSMASAWTGPRTEQRLADARAINYVAATPGNWPEFGAFPQRVSAALDALAARVSGGSSLNPPLDPSQNSYFAVGQDGDLTYIANNLPALNQHINATLDQASDPRPPLAHSHGIGDINQFDLTAFNARLTGGNVDYNNNPRPPLTHNHNVGEILQFTLAEFNARLSNGNVDFDNAPRPPLAHTHGIGEIDSFTLAEFNVRLSNGNVDFDTDPRPPTAHTHGITEINQFSLSQLNNRLTGGAVLDTTTDPRPPSAHTHTIGQVDTFTLAEFNARLTGGNVDFDNAPRPPTGHQHGLPDIDATGLTPGHFIVVGGGNNLTAQSLAIPPSGISLTGAADGDVIVADGEQAVTQPGVLGRVYKELSVPANGTPLVLTVFTGVAWVSNLFFHCHTLAQSITVEAFYDSAWQTVGQANPTYSNVYALPLFLPGPARVRLTNNDVNSHTVSGWCIFMPTDFIPPGLP